MRGFEKPFDEMNLAELEFAYEHMMRNYSPELKLRIEAEGPLSENPLIRARQEVFRLIGKYNGVVSSNTPDSTMHHPV